MFTPLEAKLSNGVYPRFCLRPQERTAASAFHLHQFDLTPNIKTIIIACLLIKAV